MLNELAVKYQTDKNNKNGHGYTEVYEKLFHNIKDTPLKILEIGILGLSSLKMWNEYFKNSIIVGIDININQKEKTKHQFFNRDNVFIDYCDQSKNDDLVNIAEKFGPFDVIIDDGSHISSHHIITFNTLFKHLNNGGFYIVEDLHTIHKNYVAKHYLNTKKTILDILSEKNIKFNLEKSKINFKQYPNLLWIKKEGSI